MEVDFVSKPDELRPADWFVWWWTWALAPPIAFAKLLRRPVLVTGVLDINCSTQAKWHQFCIRRAFALADANVFTSELEFNDLPGRFRVRNPSYVPLTVDHEYYHPDGGRVAALALLDARGHRAVPGDSRPLSWTFEDNNRIGDHIWYVSDIGKFRRHCPGWVQRYDVKALLQDIHDQNVERWQSAATR